MSGGKKPKFMTRDAHPRMAREEDFVALFERDLTAHPSVPQDLPIERIRPNPFQARTTFTGIEELAQVIRQHGFTSRLRVRHDPADPRFFQLVFGERRLRAAKVAGLTVVPCDVAEHSDDELIEIGMTENLQRQDLDPLDEARALRTFLDERGYTIRSLAERIGKDKGYIQNRLAVLDAPADVQQMLTLRPDTISVAREIAKVPTSAARQPLIEGVISGTLTKEAVRILVRDGATQPVRSTDGEASVAPVSPADTLRMDETPNALATALDRALDRDIPTLRTVFARWRLTAPQLNEQQRERVLRYIEEHLAELEQLAETMRR